MIRFLKDRMSSISSDLYEEISKLNQSHTNRIIQIVSCMTVLTQMFSSEYCRIFKINCFEEHLLTVACIRCFFDTINLKQSGICTTYSFKIVSKWVYKNDLKNCKSQNKKKNYNSYIYMLMFYYKLPWF